MTHDIAMTHILLITHTTRTHVNTTTRWGARSASMAGISHITHITHIARTHYAGMGLEADEMVFVTQLHRRARLLDRNFKRRVRVLYYCFPVTLLLLYYYVATRR